MFLTELDVSEKSIDLFECLSEKEKARGKRKGIRMAKREDFFYKICAFIKRKIRKTEHEKQVNELYDKVFDGVQKAINMEHYHNVFDRTIYEDENVIVTSELDSIDENGNAVITVKETYKNPMEQIFVEVVIE